MTNIKTKNILIALVAAICAASCRPAPHGESGSSVKTLDSIASGVNSFDQCKGGNPILIQDSKIQFDELDPNPITDEAEKTKIRTAVKDYFSALPESVQLLFLTKMGGNIFISSRVNSLCEVSHFGKNLDTANGEGMAGCFNFVQDPLKQKPAIFTIVHDRDPKHIRYYGPQIFGYLYAQFYPRLNVNTDRTGIDVAQSEPMELITHKEKVTNAFLTDMLRSPIYEVSILKNILGVDSVNELNSSSNKEPLDRLTFKMANESANPTGSIKNSRRMQVLDYVYANAYQSLHCTAGTKASAIKNFDETSKLFDEVDDSIDNLSRTLIGSDGSAPARTPSTVNSNSRSNPSSFSLGGGGFMDMLSPLLSGMGGGGAGGASMFSSLLGNSNSPRSNAGANIGSNPQSNPMSSIFTMLSSGGCQNCGKNGCNGQCCGGGGSCCGGSGSCPGGCSGGCCCG